MMGAVIAVERRSTACGAHGSGVVARLPIHEHWNFLVRASRNTKAEGIWTDHVEIVVSVRIQSGGPGLVAWFEKLAIVAFMVFFMECFAWAAHRYVMHGWGWGWHRSHHEDHDGWFEKNDLYAIVFAIVPIILFIVGLWWEPLWWAALGITVYGGIYAFVHDLLVHQRGGFRWVPKRGYFKRLLQAHRLHHAVEGKDGTVSHGFLFARKPAVLKAQLRANVQPGRRLVGSDKTGTMASLVAEK